MTNSNDVRREYWDLPGMANLYLEDSWVVDIREGGATLTFVVQFVLTEQHANYRPPREGERYCYAFGTLTFPAVTDVSWLERHNARSVDAQGKTDLGNIDVLFEQGGRYHLEGDWGVVEVESQAPVIELDQGLLSRR